MFTCMVVALLAFAASAPARPHDVLFIAVDDLRPNIAAFGPKFMHTPHLDKLASEGVLFERAYVQYSYCAPSRNSFMSGRRPDATQAYSFLDHFREQGVGDRWTSFPQYFRDRGFTVLGVGKLFHPGLPPSFDAEKSFTRFVWPSGTPGWAVNKWNGSKSASHCTPICCNATVNGWPVHDATRVSNVQCIEGYGGLGPFTCGNDTGAVVEASDPESTSSAQWCAVDRSKLTSPMVDDITTATAQHFLEAVAADPSTPWWIGVGFHKPHLPFNPPKEFFDLYPLESIAQPQHPLPPDGMPPCAWHTGLHNSWGKPAPPNITAGFRRAYYAAVSYVDDNVGKVLGTLESVAGLDANQTVVVVVGDHGWQLGEMNLWHKMTNFELATRIPLIVRAPWAQANGVGGHRVTSIVEAVDIYPSVVALALGAPVDPAEGLQGYDFSSLFAPPSGSQQTQRQVSERERAEHAWRALKPYAFSQFAKAGIFSKELQQSEEWDTCTVCTRSSIDVQGYSVRSEDWRFTVWVRWNQSSWRPNWAEEVGRELYAHPSHDGGCGGDFDCDSATVNVWNATKGHEKIAEQLLQVVWAQFRGDHLPPEGGQ